MKIKNIMFGGVMASILMMGAAYADYPDHLSIGTDTETLASVKYVRGGINAAEQYTDDAITAIVGTKNTAAAGVASNATGLYEYIDTKVASVDGATAINGLDERIDDLEDAVGDEDGGLVKDVADLQAQVGTGTVSNQIDTKISALDLANTYAGKSAFETLKAVVDDEDTGLATKVDADDVASAISTAVSEGTIKTALDAKLDGTSISGDGKYVTVSNTDGAITVSLASGKVATNWQ